MPVDALPETSTSKPSLIFSGTDCSILTVTLESTTTYQNMGQQQAKIRLQKVYVIDSAKPQEISIQVNYELSNATSVTHPMAKAFSLIVDPHSRNGSTRDFRANPPVFIAGSAQRATEYIKQYEAYRLPLLNFKYMQPTLYAVAGGAPEEYINTFRLLIEFRPGVGAWSFITIASLLSDLLERCPKSFLRLYIVGNHKIPLDNRKKVKDADGRLFDFVATGFLPTNRPPTAAEKAADEEALWDQFLLARAKSLKEWIFGSRSLDRIVLVPAVKISPDPSSGDDTVLPGDWNLLANKFTEPDGTPDIAQLRSLNLEKAQFAAGAIFIWDIMPSILFDTEIVFQTGKATVYPQDDRDGKDWKRVAENNRQSIDRLRRELKFLVPGSSGDEFTTNLTSVSLQVEGYTDTVGHKTANQLLSEQRAASVIAELSNPTPGTLPAGVAGGIGVNNFTPPSGKGFGETHLNVPTPDSTDEPRNRRVLIRVVGGVCN